MKGCARCGGQVLKNYDEEFCLQCGHDPNGVMLKSSDVSPTISRNGHKSGSRLLSSSVTQIRRRKRRLLLKGYSEEEVVKIIEAQIRGG